MAEDLKGEVSVVDCHDCAGYYEDHPCKCRLWLKRTNSSTAENCPGFIDQNTFKKAIRERWLDGGFLFGDLAIYERDV